VDFQQIAPAGEKPLKFRQSPQALRGPDAVVVGACAFGPTWA
jgi:hypothetical protein